MKLLATLLALSAAANVASGIFLHKKKSHDNGKGGGVGLLGGAGLAAALNPFGGGGDDDVRTSDFDMDDSPPPRPLFDQVFEPLLGEVGTKQFIHEQFNIVGDRINNAIDFIHDTDHGIRVCNRDQPDNQGVCFSEGACEDFDGIPVGVCDAPTPKTTCCKFERTCGEKSRETVTFFRSTRDFPENSNGPCELAIESRPGICQIRVDFIDFIFDPPSAETGDCTADSHLAVINDREADGVFGKGFSAFCGINTGNHFYMPVREPDQIIRFRIIENGVNVRRRPFNIRITQLFCRSGLQETREVIAPDGCFQYFFDKIGALASFNFDGVSPIARAQDYSICFRSNSSTCALVLIADTFDLPSSAGCRDGTALVDGELPCCDDARVIVADAEGEDRVPLGRQSFCGAAFGDANGVAISTRKPFVVRVNTGTADRAPENAGFLAAYEIIEDCP